MFKPLLNPEYMAWYMISKPELEINSIYDHFDCRDGTNTLEKLSFESIQQSPDYEKTVSKIFIRLSNDYIKESSEIQYSNKRYALHAT